MSLLTGCSTISLKYRASVSSDDGVVSQIEYSEHQPILGHSIACAATVWAAGGWCWYFAVTPTAAQRESIAEHAAQMIGEKMASRHYKISEPMVSQLGFSSLAGPASPAPVFTLTAGPAAGEITDFGQPPENEHSNFATVDVTWTKGWKVVTPFTICPILKVVSPKENKGEAIEWRNLCARIASRYEVLFTSEKNNACRSLSFEFSAKQSSEKDQFRKYLVIRSTASGGNEELSATLSSSHAALTRESVTALCRAAFAHIKSKDLAARYLDVSTAFEADPSDRDEITNEAFSAGLKVGPKSSGAPVELPPTPEISPWLAISTPKLPWLPDRFFLEAGWGALDTILSRIRYLTTHYWMDSNLGTLDYHGAVGYRLMPERRWSIVADYHHYETFDGLSYGKTKQEIDLFAAAGRYYALPAAYLSVGFGTFRMRQTQTFWGYDLTGAPGSRNTNFEECITNTGYGAVVGAGADVIQFGAARQLGVRLEVGPFLIPYSGWDKKRTCGDVLDRDLLTTDEGSPDRGWAKPFILLSTGSISAYINL